MYLTISWGVGNLPGFEPELLAMIPRPVKAIIFLYPLTEATKAFKQQEEVHLKAREQNISPKVAFFKQTISNACGMMALLHALTNNEDIVGPGLFRQIIEDTRQMSLDERVEYLETCQTLASVHASSAQEGQTRPPSLDKQMSDHFICFIEGAAELMKKFIQREPDGNNYNAIALSKVQ
ncbi:Ubiquitin carboxyl-terminal hydrolase isozyme L3 [Apophysomyces sp. BC1034]|nr:Ubiquitin carboxyl-terminal hydrolase isozyme L3 [Apophysomyces sp. BC1034]